jgi:penicillin-binding protein 1C
MKWTFWRSVLVGAFLLLVAACLLLEVGIRRAELPGALFEEPMATPTLIDRRGNAFAVIPTKTARASHPVHLQEMGPWLPEMTVGIEDHRFYEHRGVDPTATVGAILRNVRKGQVLSGASTITQQLIKITSGRAPRNFQAKLRESLAALKLERLWSKEKILQEYLNRLDYGNRRIGPEAAAMAYFGKKAKALTVSEAVFLAGLPQSPTRLNPWRDASPAFTRYQRNLIHLERLGRLPLAIGTLQEFPPTPARHDPPSRAPHFCAALSTRKIPGDFPIFTSLDLSMQDAVERLLAWHLTSVNPLGIGDAAVVVVENSTGLVRAYAVSGGGTSWDAASWPRSSGSTLKPFLYLCALDRRILTAASLLPDTPDAIMKAYSDYDPKNYSGRYYGPVRVREALGNSMNVPAVLTLSRLGARDFFASLKNWGFLLCGGFDAYGAGFILGNAPVSALELAGAYAGIARRGIAFPARFSTAEAVEIGKAASPEACEILIDVLSDNAARTKSFGNASPLHLLQRTAVKTGTSSGFRDGWCVGFNHNHTVAVWAGNLDSRPMGELLAVRSSAPLWAAVMRYLYAKGDQPLLPPNESANLTKIRVAAETGLLPRPGETTLDEWFLQGTEPKEEAASWYVNGRLALPPEYASWCESPHNLLGATLRSTEKLTITFPKDGAIFEWNPALAESRQQILPTSSQAGCEWLLDNSPITGAAIPLVRGEHTLTAKSGSQTTSITFSVY